MKTQWSPSRRQFLGGAGTVIALPFLEYFMGSNQLRAAPSNHAKIIAYYVPNGMNMSDWTPTSTAADWQLSPILSPLANVKQDILVLSGLRNDPARPDGPGDHASGTGAFLTCAHPFKTEGADIRNGISMDQIAAAQIGTQTPFASLQLGISGGDSVGNCDSGYSCAYSRNISWASATQPLPKTVNPRLLFDRLFAGTDASLSAAEIAKRKFYRTSVIDYALDSAHKLYQKLGSGDRQKLDEYLSGLRALEKRVVAEQTPSCDTPAAPPSNYSYEQHIDLMTDLMVLALQCDSTRIITFMLNNAGSGRSHGFLNVPEAHHQLSHHQNVAATLSKLTVVDTFEVLQFAKLVEKLKITPDPSGGGTLLDHTTLFFSSEIADGNAHNHNNLPVLIAGNANGAFSTGRHVRYTNNERISNLFISLLQASGVTINTFGDGSGPLHSL